MDYEKSLPSTLKRYERQMTLPEIGREGQESLCASKVLIIGAGGLGCPILSYLAAAGIGTIILIDPDNIELHNLHRQTLYTMADIGQPKVKAAADRLKALNPDLNIITYKEAFTPANAEQLIKQVDCVVDAADLFAVTYCASDLCLKLNKPFITASVLGLKGYAGLFCYNAPSYRALFPQLGSNGANCASAGVTGPLCGIIASLQAQLTLSVLIQTNPSPAGFLFSFDMHQWRLNTFSFRHAKEPTKDSFYFIDPTHITQNDIIFDVRSPKEGKRIDPRAKYVKIEALPCLKDKEMQHKRLVICCKTGLRAWKTARHYAQLGHKNIALIATQ